MDDKPKSRAASRGNTIRKTKRENQEMTVNGAFNKEPADPPEIVDDDALILQYFMDFTDEKSESNLSNQSQMTTTRANGIPEIILNEEELKLKEKQNKHRLNNIRHRQRKQNENECLRRDVVLLEEKLRQLEASSTKRKEIKERDEIAIEWNKSLSQTEKRKRDEAQDENKILTTTIHSQRDLIQLYFKRITTTHCMESNHLILENEPFLMYTLAGCSAVRQNGYEWIMTQMKHKMGIALTYLHSYVGSHIEEDTKIYLGDNSVDLVRNHMWSFPVHKVAQSSWESFTRINNDPNASRKTTRLEEIDPNTFYTRIVIEDGIIPGKCLTLNMLQRRFIEGDKAIISFRTISEDSRYPIEGNGLCDLSVAGWLSFQANPDGTTHARVFVKFRTDHSNGQETLMNEYDSMVNERPNRKTQANQWIMSVISKMFTTINGTTRQALKTPPPATTSLTVLRKHGELREMNNS